MADGGVEARYNAGFPSDFAETPPVAGSADAEIYAAGARLRDWARYLAKNSSIFKAVLDARQIKGVGEGLTYEPLIKDRKGRLLTSLNDAVKRVHEDWSRRVDTTEELSRQELEKLAWREWDTVGEIFGRKVYRGLSATRLGYQVQPIKSELVPYGWYNGTSATMGIDRDEWGKALRYWVWPYQQNPAAWGFTQGSITPRALPAEQVRHLRRQEEIDATRGVTLFHAVIFRTNDIAEYQQSHRQAARASANLFLSITRDLDYTPPEPNKHPQGTDATTDQRTFNFLDLQILDGLRSGEAVNFHAPQHPNQNAVDFVNQELRQLAAACRVAFSWIAYVFDRAYAAQRTELVHAWEFITEDRGQFVRDFAQPLLYDQPLRVALLEGRLPRTLLAKADRATLFDVRIGGPVMPSIDPVVDKKSAKLDQDNGWESRHGNIRRFGRNPAQVDAEIAADTAAAPPTTDNEENTDATV